MKFSDYIYFEEQIALVNKLFNMTIGYDLNESYDQKTAALKILKLDKNITDNLYDIFKNNLDLVVSVLSNIEKIKTDSDKTKMSYILYLIFASYDKSDPRLKQKKGIMGKIGAFAVNTIKGTVFERGKKTLLGHDDDSIRRGAIQAKIKLEQLMNIESNENDEENEEAIKKIEYAKKELQTLKVEQEAIQQQLKKEKEEILKARSEAEKQQAELERKKLEKKLFDTQKELEDVRTDIKQQNKEVKSNSQDKEPLPKAKSTKRKQVSNSDKIKVRKKPETKISKPDEK
jgi:hypothetical protein